MIKESYTDNFYSYYSKYINNALTLRPSPKQFNIYYNYDGIRKYEPDFIVETQDNIYMIEIKASNERDNPGVKEKANAAKTYCSTVSNWNSKNNGKSWTYVIIPHDKVKTNSSFVYLVKNS